ncbi:MAG: preprotein translocase subunit SecE [Bdellovibrionota bacterium]
MANIFSKSIEFVSESYKELKKVSTPSMSETKRVALAVILIVIMVATMIFVIDYFFSILSGAVVPKIFK